MEKKEMLQFSTEAIKHIRGCADSSLPEGSVDRLVYVDDEGDLCTLNDATLSDALHFTVRQEDECETLTVRIVMKAETTKTSTAVPPAEERAAASATPASSGEAERADEVHAET